MNGTRCLENLNKGCMNFSCETWGSYEDLVHCQSEDPCAR